MAEIPQEPTQSTDLGSLLGWAKQVAIEAGWDDEMVVQMVRAADELERLRAVLAAARMMPRRTPAPGGASTEHQFKIEAATVWALDAALTAYDKAHAP